MKALYACLYSLLAFSFISACTASSDTVTTEPPSPSPTSSPTESIPTVTTEPPSPSPTSSPTESISAVKPPIVRPKTWEFATENIDEQWDTAKFLGRYYYDPSSVEVFQEKPSYILKYNSVYLGYYNIDKAEKEEEGYRLKSDSLYNYNDELYHIRKRVTAITYINCGQMTYQNSKGTEIIYEFLWGGPSSSVEAYNDAVAPPESSRESFVNSEWFSYSLDSGVAVVAKKYCP